jgi:hypothetical protein
MGGLVVVIVGTRRFKGLKVYAKYGDVAAKVEVEPAIVLVVNAVVAPLGLLNEAV